VFVTIFAFLQKSRQTNSQQVLNEFFIPVTADKVIYGETIIAMNFSGGVPQHSAVYAGTSSTGEIYIMQKPGLSMAPNIIPLKDAGSGMHDDFKFYNEKGSIKK